MISNTSTSQEQPKLKLDNKANNNLSNNCKDFASSKIVTSTLNECNSVYENLYANDNNNSGSVTVYNKGAYVAFLSWGYYLNDQYYSFESPYIPVLQSYTINLPAGATGINILFLLSIDFTEFNVICRKEFSQPCTKCFYLWGTLFYYGCSQMPCPSNIVSGSPTPPENTVPKCNQ